MPNVHLLGGVRRRVVDYDLAPFAALLHAEVRVRAHFRKATLEPVAGYGDVQESGTGNLHLERQQRGHLLGNRTRRQFEFLGELERIIALEVAKLWVRSRQNPDEGKILARECLLECLLD